MSNFRDGLNTLTGAPITQLPALEYSIEKHYMLDVETLGVNSNSPVASIGAVQFFPELLGTGYSTIGKSCQWNITDLQEQFDVGCVPNYSTIKWWLGQSKEAIAKTFAQTHTITTLQALNMFHTFCAMDDNGKKVDSKNIYIWGNGATFDNIIVRNLCAKFGVTYPAAYANDLDLRTLKWLAKSLPKVEIEDVGTGHNAVDDAMYQSKLALVIISMLQGYPKANG